jgi:hypothetical protein
MIHTALLILNVGTNWGGGGQHTLRPLYPREEGPVTIVKEAGWAPGPVWTVVTGVEEEHPVRPPRFEPRIYMSINLLTASGEYVYHLL